MRRARIQVKPNVAKAAKKETVPSEPVPEKIPAVENPIPTPAVVEEAPKEVVEDVVMENQNPSPQDEAPSESMKSLHVDVSKNQNHVHFPSDVIDNERNPDGVGGGGDAGNQNNVSLNSPNSMNQFVAPHPGRLMTPRSRNVSMCEDESILQPKQPREKKRFTGKEELDTKTWKMSDLTRWNPRNEHTSFKRERRSSTSSTVITKSEMGDYDAPSPRINAPQVKIGADGRLVIDETSLVVQSAQINHESVWETVEEGRMGSKITSMSFRTRIFRKPNLWSPRETDLFYEVLQCTGQDFGLMHHYLPQRSRPELKAKYNREEKQNWNRISHTISHPVRLDGELEVRIAKMMAEIEEEIQEKKAKSVHEKAEERRIREEARNQKAAERNQEKMKKMQAKELVKQAKELEKDARIAAKLNQKATGKAEKEAEKAEKEAKSKEKSDARNMALEAKRIALEARTIIKETRKVEKEKEKEVKVQAESHNLEREAERIIRRLMQESQREERRAAQERNNQQSDISSPTSPNSTVPTSSSSTKKSKSNKKIAGDGDDNSSSDSSESSSTESSDEDAVTRDTARREKRRMREERRSVEPRKTVTKKKPVYVNTQDIKYANIPISETVAMVQATKGQMFMSADEDDEVPARPHSKSMDTSSANDAPSSSTPAPILEDLATGSAPSSPVKTPEEPIEVEETKEVEEEKEEEEKEKEEAEIPQSVYDVIEEVRKCSQNKKDDEEPKKTPKKVEGRERKKKKIEPKVEQKESEEQMEAEEPEESGEPVAKVARIKDDPEDIIIDVVGDSDDEAAPQEQTSQKDDSVVDMDSDEFIDVETVDPGPEIVINEPSASTIRAASASASEVTIQPSTSSIPSYSLARRTVKRPITWVNKK